ncbi:MAG: helix-turn-helix domain-containing protein, partial [Bacteroidota bacterium]
VQLDERAQLLVENYYWPGNIRELRNVVEQMSVLAERKLIFAEDLMTYIPNIAKRNLPMLANQDKENKMQEREILYKLLFDMKNDLNDLKSLVFGLIRGNDLNVPDVGSMPTLQAAIGPASDYQYSKSNNYSDLSDRFAPTEANNDYAQEDYNSSPILIHHRKEDYNDMEVVEETLSLEENEKRIIRKALKKHNGRRKDAASELGISERTLYRKIKEYDIPE